MNHILRFTHLVVKREQKEIIHGISGNFQSSAITVIMGPNGSGKSTFAHVLMGDPAFDATGKIFLDKQDMGVVFTEERSKKGLFLSFQTPVAIAGISVIDLLRSAYAERQVQMNGKKKVIYNPVFRKQTNTKGIDWTVFIKTIRKESEFLSIKPELLERSIHEGFSGGERKKIELLQAIVLKPKFAIFDEIDTGLDVDALNIVGKGLQRLVHEKSGVILITHNTRLMKYCKPDCVMVMNKGVIVACGGISIAKDIEEHGYAQYK